MEEPRRSSRRLAEKPKLVEEPVPKKAVPKRTTTVKPKTTRAKKGVSAAPLTLQERLAAKIAEIEEEKEFSNFLSSQVVADLLFNKEKGIKVDTPERHTFIRDCWRYYSGNPLSYVINKYLYLGRPELKVGPHFNEQDMLMVYDNILTFNSDFWIYLRFINADTVYAKQVPYNIKLFLDILITGLQATSLLKVEDYFLTTTNDIRLYRGFRMLNNNDSMLFGKNKSFISTTLDISTALSHAKPVSDTDPSKSILIEYSFTPGIKLIKAAALYEDILITAFSKKEEEHVIMPGYTFTLVEKGTYMVETNSVTLRRSSGEKVTTQVVNTPGYSLPYYHIKVIKS